MNIYQIVINTVAASAADITESGGFINITETATTDGPSISIPKGRIMGAKRVLAGEKRQIWTVTIPSTPSNSTTYTVSVSGKSTVTGVSKTFTASYTTATSGTTQGQLSAGLAAGLTSSEAPYLVTDGTSTLTITAKSGTPVISAASNLLTVANSTVALSSTANITTSGVISTSETPFVSGDLGKVVTINDGTTFLTGIIKTYTGTNSVTAVPFPKAAMTGNNDKLFILDNTGATLENNYAYAGLPGVTLASATKYVIYEIDAVAPSYAGNGARPDAIDSKYILYVNSGDSNLWTSTTGFEDVLSSKLGFTL